MRNQVRGGRSDTIVQAGTVYGGVHIHQTARDERGDIEDPIIATVERSPGGCLPAACGVFERARASRA